VVVWERRKPSVDQLDTPAIDERPAAGDGDQDRPAAVVRCTDDGRTLRDALRHGLRTGTLPRGTGREQAEGHASSEARMRQADREGHAGRDDERRKDTGKEPPRPAPGGHRFRFLLELREG
jgi:hypothetical protein